MTKEAVDRNKVSYFYPDNHPQSYQNIGKQFNPMTTVKLVTNFNQLADEVPYQEPIQLKMDQIVQYTRLI